jgi:hypothetical protein
MLLFWTSVERDHFDCEVRILSSAFYYKFLYAFYVSSIILKNSAYNNIPDFITLT